MFAKNQNLEKTIHDAFARFEVAHPESSELLFDRHFVRAHLGHILGTRLQAGVEVDANWIAERWAAHLGLSEQALRLHRSEVTPLVNDFVRSLRSELQTNGGHYRTLSNLICAA